MKIRKIPRKMKKRWKNKVIKNVYKVNPHFNYNLQKYFNFYLICRTEDTEKNYIIRRINNGINTN